jgi:hypothetical protein
MLHRDVEEYDVRLMFSYFADRISPISRLAHNFDVRLGMENLANAATDALVVIYHEHTKCASKHNLSGSRTTNRFIPRATTRMSVGDPTEGRYREKAEHP